MNAIRWILVVPAGAAAWFAVLMLGLLAVGVLDTFCPPELTVSGQCTASWYAPAFDTLVASFAGLSAVAVVLVPTIIAPSKRESVANLSFAAGAVVATVNMASSPSDSWGPYIAAIVAGLTTLLAVRSIMRGRPAGTLSVLAPRVQGILDDLFNQVGEPEPGSALDQIGLRDGQRIVED